MMRTRSTITALVVALGTLLAGVTAVRAAETPIKGSFWYIIDSITETSADAEAVIWVTLPPVWHGQEVTLGAIEPAPVAILEDAETGNRIIEWRLRPEARQIDPTGSPWQQYFHYDFELTQIEVRKHGPFVITEAYDRTTADYLRYTAPEPGIQTDGRILDLAREIVGTRKDPYVLGRMFYGWLMENLVFKPNNDTGWDAMSIREAGQGDCSQFSTLFVALCRSVGIPARTVANTWLWGGRHVFAEFMLPGHGWVPADVSLGQLLTAGRGGLSEAEVEVVLTERAVPMGDAGWTYGNLFGNRMIISLGTNISFRSPTLDRQITLQTMTPGGIDARPAGFRLQGYNSDVVHGGFYVFDEVLTEEAAHDLAHQRLAKFFFKADVDDFAEDVCRSAGPDKTGGMENWINLGKAYLHKGEYYKAEAAFQRALRLNDAHNLENQVLLVWVHNYLGNCYDLLGRREMAMEQYHAALAYGDDFRGAVRYAERYLQAPFSSR